MYSIYQCFTFMLAPVLGNEPRKIVEGMKNLTVGDVALSTSKGIDVLFLCISKPINIWDICYKNLISFSLNNFKCN
jgi:hypothetical protein